MDEEKLIQERKEKFLKLVKSKTSWIVYFLLAIILWINVKIRTLPMKINPATGNPGLWDVAKNTWTLGPDLDPFLFLRYAKDIVSNGKLMIFDSLRYASLGYETANETQLLPYLIAYTHKLINLFGEFSVDYAGVIFPVLASIFTAIFFFLLVRKIFEQRGSKLSSSIALISTLIMVVLPSLLTRTIAGIPEKESIGFGLMFAAFYFFLTSWKSKNIKNAMILGVFAGLMSAAMGLIWGGVIFIYSTIGIAGFIAFVLQKIGKKEIITYSCWLVSSMIFWIPFTLRTTLIGFITAPVNAFCIMVLVFMVAQQIIYKTKLKNYKLLQYNWIRKMPRPLFIILLCLVSIFILSIFTLGYDTLLNMVKGVLNALDPNLDRLISTVAENRQPYFNELKSSMGPLFKEIPLFFWLFFVGSIFLFNEMIKKLNSNEKVILTTAYTFFLITLIFSRISASSLFNGENTISKFTNLIGYVVLFSSAGYVYYKRFKKGELNYLKNIKFDYIFIFAMVFIGIVATRSGIRFIMVFTPIAAIITGYFVVDSLSRALKSKNEVTKILLWILAIIVILATLVTINAYYQQSIATANVNVPSSYTQQWQRSMGWVRENTSEDAVFGHWWDYGYWLQSIGERSTMLDGGNVIIYWNYLMGRHVLTGETESEALEVLYNHGVTHFLIDSTDIGKYSAYSLIGSDENYDRFSWIGTYLLQENQIKETKNQTVYVYAGGTGFDEDIILNEGGKQVLLPAQAAVTGALIISQNKNEDYSQPESIVIYNNQQYKVPLRYLYVNGELIDFGNERENTLDAAVYIFPKLEQTGAINKIGAAMYLSPRNMRALWVKLYLLEQGEQFKLVHTEPSAIHNQFLIPQGIDIGDIVYFQGIQGPIKIWEIDYKENEKVNTKYTQITFPEEIAERAYR